MKGKFKILLASGDDELSIPGPFEVRFGGEYVHRRLIPHLTDYKRGKGIADKKCLEYRKRYNLDYSQYITGIIVFPAVLPQIVDNPENYIPSEIPQHNVLIAAGLHPDLMEELIKKAATRGCRALIAPKENPAWFDSHFEKKIKKLCMTYGIECVFPRPFCALEKSGQAFIDEFLKAFRLGRPQFEIKVNHRGIIEDVLVESSAPCGATYHVAAGLIGVKKEEAIEVANKLWHCYACLASSKIDTEIGDSVMHLAARINLAAIKKAVEKSDWEGKAC
ncbi:DUF166 domain-containing protein [Thermovorax subterraneus]|nr:DUF166 domain-containing protein [Thermovorax subterraneus]